MLHCGSCSGTKSSAAGELLVEGAAQGEGDVDHVGEELPPEQRPHAPQAEGGRPLGALHRPHAAVVLGQTGRGRVEQVGRVLLEGLEDASLVAVEDEGAEAGHEEHLVGVPDDAVGPLEAGHQVPVPVAEHGRAAVGRVDVQPHAVVAADVGDLLQRVERPDGRGAGTGHDGDDRPAPRRGDGPAPRPAAGGPCGPRSSSPTRTTCRLPRPRMPAARATL